MSGDVFVWSPWSAGVPGQVREPEVADELIPVRRVPHGRRREDAALGADQQLVAGLLAISRPQCEPSLRDHCPWRELV